MPFSRQLLDSYKNLEISHETNKEEETQGFAQTK